MSCWCFKKRFLLTPINKYFIDKYCEKQTLNKVDTVFQCSCWITFEWQSLKIFTHSTILSITHTTISEHTFYAKYDVRVLRWRHGLFLRERESSDCLYLKPYSVILDAFISSVTSWVRETTTYNKIWTLK